VVAGAPAARGSGLALPKPPAGRVPVSDDDKTTVHIRERPAGAAPPAQAEPAPSPADIDGEITAQAQLTAARGDGSGKRFEILEAKQARSSLWVGVVVALLIAGGLLALLVLRP
jgi:hypothetical protein